jgi:lambda family phage minor tail protein L
MAENRLLGLTSPAILTLYALDLSPLGTNDTTYFCNYSDSGGAPVLSDGIEYIPVPIIVANLGRSISNAEDSPQLSIADVNGAISGLLNDHDGELGGAILSISRIYADNLDNGDDPDPSAALQPTNYTIENHDSDGVVYTFFLGSAYNFDSRLIPRRTLRQLLDSNGA